MGVSKQEITGSRRGDLSLSPWEVVSRVCNLQGSVFFDSGARTESGPQLSIVAAEPESVMRGKLDTDLSLLSDAIRDRQRPFTGCGYPNGLAAGAIDYDGGFEFGFYDECAVFDHGIGEWLDPGIVERLLSGKLLPCAESAPVLRFESPIDNDGFCEMVRRAQDYIGAGDIYQVNLAHRFESPCVGHPWPLYGRLRENSPAPYGAWLMQSERTILSSSPESFLRMSGQDIRTRPIKGTRPRRSDPVADDLSAQELLSSPKELAELIMITDLERSDLGRICEYGSVEATSILALERFQQVFHLVSTIDGRMRTEVGHVEALAACFPGGSITGAPKKRAMEIIREIEPEPRGLYTGAIGYFGYNAESQFNIAIRTLVAERDKAHFHVGAGIVADSEPEAEYRETLHKAEGILSLGR